MGIFDKLFGKKEKRVEKTWSIINGVKTEVIKTYYNTGELSSEEYNNNGIYTNKLYRVNGHYLVLRILVLILIPFYFI